MTTQPEALLLAECLEQHEYCTHGQMDRSAAELRRLHDENERLHQINWSHEVKLSVRGYEIQIEDLRAVNAELLEALKLALYAHGVVLLSDPPQEAWKVYGVEQKARAAIAKAEGQA